MYTVIQVQTLDEAVYISYSTNTLGKTMNPTILSIAMGKMVGQTGLFCPVVVSGLGEGKLNSNLLNSA